jgi:hypothetical protein
VRNWKQKMSNVQAVRLGSAVPWRAVPCGAVS